MYVHVKQNNNIFDGQYNDTFHDMIFLHNSVISVYKTINIRSKHFVLF